MEENLELGYNLYLTYPLATIQTQPLLYEKMWIVLTGRSICHPHPHRHYNRFEFEDKYNEDMEFRSFVQQIIQSV